MPLQSTPGETKMTISPEWTQEERADLAQRIETDIQQLVQQEAEWRKTIRWEAPCFRENASKRSNLEQMAGYVRTAPMQFLEVNRQNFKGYIE